MVDCFGEAMPFFGHPPRKILLKFFSCDPAPAGREGRADESTSIFSNAKQAREKGAKLGVI
jgi:hypothetical protein